MRLLTEWTVTIRDKNAKVAFKRMAPAYNADDALQMALEDMAIAWHSLLRALRETPRMMPANLTSLHETHQSADAPHWTRWRIGASMARAANAAKIGFELEADARARIWPAVQVIHDHEMDLNGITLAEQAEKRTFCFLRTECARRLPSITDEITARLGEAHLTVNSKAIPMTRTTQLALLDMGVSYLVARRPDKGEERHPLLPYDFDFETSPAAVNSATLSAAHAIAAPKRRAAYIDVVSRTPGYAQRQEHLP